MPRLHVHRITSIGAVESGDNPEAEILFWKRAVSTDERERLAEKGQALPDGSFPIASIPDLRNAIQSFGRAGNKPAVKRHIIKRARSLGRIDLLPEGWVTKTANPSEGRTNGGGPVDTLDLSSLDDDQAEPILAFVAGLQKAGTEAAEKIAALEADVEDEDDPLIDLPEPVAKALAERDEQIAKAEAKAATAEEAVAKLQDERLTERYTERAEKLSNMLGKPAEVAPVLKDLAKAAPEAFAKLDSMFDTLLTWDGMADLLKEHGDNAATGSAADTLTALATDIRKENPEMSMADARVEAHHQRPELRELMREEGS